MAKRTSKKKLDPFARQKRDAERERIARENLRKAIDKRIREGDILPDLPGPDFPLYTPLGGVASRLNPYVGLALGTYAALENTERWWGPRLFDYYGQGYPDPLRPEAIEVRGTPRMPTKAKRKVTKANKATKMAWDMLRKRMKGKMTKEKCQKLLKKCSMMASKANPNTKSRIGKGKSQTCKDCRKIRKSIWNTNKRY